MAIFSSTPLVVWLSLAFFSGSIPFGFLLVRLKGLGDVRQVGSGNIGATNVMRAGGKALGVLTLLLDILKGVVPVLLARWAGLTPLQISLVGLLAMLGHLFTPWLKFKGGKGVATTLGVALVFEPWMALGGLITFLISVALSRMVSLGSILACLASPIVLGFLLWSRPPLPDRTGILLVWSLLCLLVVAKHHENIRRILQGKENRLGQKRAES